MAAISQTTFSNTFPWMEMYLNQCWLVFRCIHVSLGLNQLRGQQAVADCCNWNHEDVITYHDSKVYGADMGSSGADRTQVGPCHLLLSGYTTCPHHVSIVSESTVHGGFPSQSSALHAANFIYISHNINSYNRMKSIKQSLFTVYWIIDGKRFNVGGDILFLIFNGVFVALYFITSYSISVRRNCLL